MTYFILLAIAILSEVPSNMQYGFDILNKEGTRNAVLNYMQLGKDALYLGHYDLAATCFEKALEGIEIVYANTKMAAKARSLWHEEGAKTFKGEPYERAMAYFYRGLTYIHAGETDNARACFESGLLQDAFAEEKQYRSDFALLVLMSGWCAQQMGREDLANQSFQDLRTLRPTAPIPDSSDNVMILVETGAAPRKLADGVGHAALVFRRGKVWLDVEKNRKKNFKDVRAYISIDGSASKQVFPIESIYFQSATRGGRPIDRILDGQVKFKKSTADFGKIFLEMGQNWDNDKVGTALVGIGSVVSLIAINAKPHADIRYWKNLPDAVHYLSIHLEPGIHQIKVRFADKNDSILSDMTKSVTVNIPKDGRSQIVLVIGHRQLFCSGSLPPNDIHR